MSWNSIPFQGLAAVNPTVRIAIANMRYVLIFSVSRYPKAISQTCLGDADNSDTTQLDESALVAIWSTRENFGAAVVDQAPMLTPLFAAASGLKLDTPPTSQARHRTGADSPMVTSRTTELEQCSQ